MFGKNAVAGPRKSADGFLVHSMFYTIQGEGPHVGRPAIFLRLAGCNLRCFWCDTDFEKGDVFAVTELAAKLRLMGNQHDVRFIVITGGEPMLQPLSDLIVHPYLTSFEFQIETAGSVWPDRGLPYAPTVIERGRLSIVCSPKTPLVVTSLRSAIEYDVYWKYIIRAQDKFDSNDGLPRASTQQPDRDSTLFRPAAAFKHRIFVQPCDEQDMARNQANRRLAVHIAQEHGYRLSLQIHKIAEVD